MFVRFGNGIRMKLFFFCYCLCAYLIIVISYIRSVLSCSDFVSESLLNLVLVKNEKERAKESDKKCLNPNLEDL